MEMNTNMTEKRIESLEDLKNAIEVREIKYKISIQFNYHMQ